MVSWIILLKLVKLYAASGTSPRVGDAGESAVQTEPDTRERQVSQPTSVIPDKPTEAAGSPGEDAGELSVDKPTVVAAETSLDFTLAEDAGKTANDASVDTEDIPREAPAEDKPALVVLETPTEAGIYPGDATPSPLKTAPAVLTYEDDNELPIVHPIKTQDPKRSPPVGVAKPGKPQKTKPKIKPKPNRVAPSNGTAKARDASKVKLNKVAPENGKGSGRLNGAEPPKAASSVTPEDKGTSESDVRREPPAVFTISAEGIANPAYIAAPEDDPRSEEKQNDDAVNETNV